jgi:hypothetical protein
VPTGASTIAVDFFAAESVHTTLENWTDVMRAAKDANLIHFTTSPPGQALIHYYAAQIFDAIPFVSKPVSMALRPYQCTDPRIMSYKRGELMSVGFVGMLMPLWAALMVIPVYFSARTLFGDSDVALRIAQWGALIPAILLFLPTWNSMYPLLCITAFSLLLAGFEQRRGRSFAGRLIAAGAVMSAATFLNFAVLPILLLFGLFTLGYWYVIEKRAGGLRWAIGAGVWFGVGLMSVWFVFWLASGLTPLDILRVSFDEHSELVNNPYLPWLILNPYDTLMFLGWSLAATFIWGVWIAVRMAIGAGRSSSLERIDILAFASVVTLLAVDFSAVAHGETARILSFFAPFLLLIGGRLFVRSRQWDFPLLATQAVTVLAMAAVLPSLALDLNPQPQGPRTDVISLDIGDQRPVNATFTSDDYAGKFELVSHRFVADLSQQAITLETTWRGIERVERPYRFEAIARAENSVDGEIVSEPLIWNAQNGNYLPTCWREGDVIRDVVVLRLPLISAGVVWTITVRAIDERTGDMMRVTAADGAVSDGAILDPVNYP